MKRTSSIVMVVIATLLGLFFGNALGGWLWALVLGAISLAGAYYVMWQYEGREPVTTTVPPTSGAVQMEDPKFARFLFNDTRSAALWLPIRIFVGWQWFDASLHKLSDPKWMDTGEAIKGYWTSAVKVPETGRPPITYDWWRGFIQFLLDNNAHTWFSKVIAIGELLVGLGLITGALVGIAAFGGALMNMSFLLSGSTSTNPLMLFLALALVLAWKVAGWVGIDRVLLPLLGTPWHAGDLFRRTQPQQPVTT